MKHAAMAGFAGALALVHGALATYCLASIARVRAAAARSVDHPALGDDTLAVALYGLFNVASATMSVGYAAALHSGGATGVIVAESARIVASALLVHLVLVLASVPRPRRPMLALYAVFGGLAIANAVGGVTGYAGMTIGSVTLPFGELPDLRAAPGPLGGPAAALLFAAALAAPITLGRSVLRGRPDGLAFAGATVLAVCASNDALHALGLVPGPPLAIGGFAVFAGAIALTWMFRSGRSRRELSQKASELRKRERELATAYAQLRADKEELVRKEQLAVVGELSAVIAHEVRNPLAIISNAVATLRRGQIEATDRDTLLGILDEETSRLNRIVGDLLRYARPVDLQRQLVSVREVLDRTLALTASQPEVVIDIVEEGAAPRVWADANLLRQALDNLVTNAVQAMSGDGVLGVTIAPDECDGAPGVVLMIQDTGEGMNTQVRRRALDPFFTTRPSGTGLGLAIVARIIDAHGGRLSIESVAGAGTSVHVLLPVGREPARTDDGDPEERVSDVPLLAELKRAMGRK